MQVNTIKRNFNLFKLNELADQARRAACIARVQCRPMFGHQCSANVGSRSTTTRLCIQAIKSSHIPIACRHCHRHYLPNLALIKVIQIKTLYS